VHPHTFGVPPPPHVVPAAQVLPQPTVRMVPQLSAAETGPQFFPSLAQNWLSLSAVQPQVFATPPPAHDCGAVHDPQLATVRRVLQLSKAVTLPQLAPLAEQKAASD